MAQTQMRVEHYRRREDGWLFLEYRGPEDRVELESLGCGVRLADLYERVDLAAATESERASPGE